MRNSGPHRDLSPIHPAGKQPQWDSNPQPSTRSPHPSFQVACLCLKLVPKLETTGDTRTQGLLFKGSFFCWGGRSAQPNSPSSCLCRTPNCTAHQLLKRSLYQLCAEGLLLQGTRPCVLSWATHTPWEKLGTHTNLRFPM